MQSIRIPFLAWFFLLVRTIYCIEDYVDCVVDESNQFPNIGPGNVFHDNVFCRNVGMVTLGAVKCPTSGSGSPINANWILRGAFIRTEILSGGEEDVGIVRPSVLW